LPGKAKKKWQLKGKRKAGPQMELGLVAFYAILWLPCNPRDADCFVLVKGYCNIKEKLI